MKLIFAFILFIYTPLWPFDSAILPGDSFVIINKKTNELAYFDKGSIQLQTKVATGKTDELTPEGVFKLVVKAKNPVYRKLNIPGNDPRNPLGSRWLGFNARGTDGRIYGIHGTNNPDSIGKYISEGCIRMDKEPLEFLYEKIKIGTIIIIVHSDASFEELAKQYGGI